MSNECIFLLWALIDIVCVFVFARKGVEWLYSSMIVNLLLITIYGAKLITLFGFVTNVGNVYYACVFLATHFILEREGKKGGIKAIWVGAVFVLFFVIMSRSAFYYQAVDPADPVARAIATFFTFEPRVVFGSIVAFVFAQYINITVYEWIRKKTHGNHLWLRSNGANATAQLVDSALFFLLYFLHCRGFRSFKPYL